uniref:Uncharacterized protein n=1 Tax=Anopheles epiroticus TaxID=199890 RepID=A0A182PAB6_9DIPT
MSVRWQSPEVGQRRRSGGSVDECEISMLAADGGATMTTDDDGDHSRSRNGGVRDGHRTEQADRIASGGRCPVARVDVDLSDEEESALEQDDTDEIVVLDEASERLLGKWNGNAKGR